MIIFATNDGIHALKLDKNFTQVNASTELIKFNRSSTNPIEFHYNLYENYIIFQNEGAFHKFQFNINNKVINTYEFPKKDLRLDSKLALDWTHNLLYFTENKKKIFVAEIKNLSHRFLIANKTLDIMICLSVNPIDSFIIWCEHSYQTGSTLINKALQDGSNRTLIFELIDDYIRELVIDYSSKRLFWFSSLEMSSINFDGSDNRVISESESVFDIYDFDVFGDYVYWTKFNRSQIFRASVGGFETYETNVTLNLTTYKFQIVNNSKQPKGTNQCLNSECSQFCLPVHQITYRCICFDKQNCSENEIDVKVKEKPQIIKTTSSLQTIFTTHSITLSSKPTTFSQTQESKNTFLNYSIDEQSDSGTGKYAKEPKNNSLKLRIIITILSSISIFIIIVVLIVIKYRVCDKSSLIVTRDESTQPDLVIYSNLKLENSNNIYS
jgi:hypothetical protein